MWSMEIGLLQDDFEDGVGVGDVHESVGVEHETQQAAAPAVVGDAGHVRLGEVGAAENNAANPALLKSTKSRLSLLFIATMRVPPTVPLTVTVFAAAIGFAPAPQGRGSGR
jgi:hypothetical protein